MTSKSIGIEDARKQLGDLVTQAQQGADVILTRNGKAAARIVRYVEHEGQPMPPDGGGGASSGSRQ